MSKQTYRPVKHKLDALSLTLPKPHKQTSKDINYLCLKKQTVISLNREKRKQYKKT